jgi:hypothetical protein
VTFGRYLAGVLCLGLVVVPIGALSCAWRARLRPDWSGGIARLAEIILGLTVTTCVLEILGSISLFRTYAAVPALAAVGVGGWWAAAHVGAGKRAARPLQGARQLPAASLAAKRIAVVVLSFVAADWATRTVDAYHHGMTGIDTLWYHLPFAARFAQEGSITPLHFVDAELVTAFYPATSELFHGLGILLMGNDVLSPAINLGWLSVLLLAAWCIGKPFGVGIPSLTAVAALMATPNIVATQPAGGYDDIVVFALLLSCAALLINTHAGPIELRSFGIAIAALAAGLAVGTKWTSLVPAAALTLAVVFAASRRRRVLEGGIFLAGLALIGAFWYVRNWIAVGNPLPSVHLKIGPLSFSNDVNTKPQSTWAHYILNAADWHRYFLPGFRTVFGPVWWAVVALAAAGLVLGALRGPDRMTRLIAIVGILIAIGFVYSPQVLDILGAPVFFADNLRYADPAVIYGLALLPLIRDLSGGRWQMCLMLAFGGITLACQLDETLWPIHLLSNGFAAPITGLDSVLGALLGCAVLVAGLLLVGRRPSEHSRLPRSARVVVPAFLALALAIFGVGFAFQRFYLEHRYASDNLDPPFAWAQSISGARIGTAGNLMQLQYMLYGRSLSNYVQYIGVPGPTGSYTPVTSCREWRRQVNNGHYRYIVTSTDFVTSRREALTVSSSDDAYWTSHDRHSHLVRDYAWVISPTAYVGITVFKLNGDLDVSACSSPALQHPGQKGPLN